MTSFEDIFKFRKKNNLTSVKKKQISIYLSSICSFELSLVEESSQCTSPYFASWYQDRIKKSMIHPVIKEILLIDDSVKKIETLVFSNVTDMLKTIPVEDFQRWHQKREQCLHWCVAAQGNYFEVDWWLKHIKTLANKNSDSLLNLQILYINNITIGSITVFQFYSF